MAELGVALLIKYIFRSLIRLKVVFRTDSQPKYRG